jgi:16S rRNA (guanine966-N2)-methyltransferase
VRPTTDLAKEALFNVLNNHIDFEAVRVLDLFAGTGNISLEFASRGASGVIAVENNPRCVTFIKRMASELEFENFQVIRGDAMGFLEKALVRFDLVFADPPYDFPRLKEIPDLVFDGGLLESDGWLVLEHGPGTSFNTHPRLIENRKYGRVHFSFFR